MFSVLRVRLILASQSEHDCRSESDGREEDLRASVVLGGDATSVLRATKHDLDRVTALLAALVVLDGPATRLPAWDAGLYSFVFQRISEPVGVTAPRRPATI
jgi:hypothetical protein